jgi:hypothetical protein
MVHDRLGIAVPIQHSLPVPECVALAQRAAAAHSRLCIRPQPTHAATRRRSGGWRPAELDPRGASPLGAWAPQERCRQVWMHAGCSRYRLPRAGPRDR